MNGIQLLVRRAFFLTTCALAASLAATAGAQTVLVDFGNNELSYRGIAVPAPDLNGNYWNSMQPGTPSLDMVDIDNVPTTIDLYFDTPVGTDSYNGPAGPTDVFPVLSDHLQLVDIDTEALGILAVPEAVFDYAASPGSTTPETGNKTRFQLQGLNPQQTYTLTLFGSHSFSNNLATVYTIYSDDTYATVVASQSLNVMDPGDPALHNRDQVAVFSDIAPQTDAILYIEFIGSGGSLGYLNAFSIMSEAADFLVGDYNNNGEVDAADYTVWRDNLDTDNVLPNDPVGGTIGTQQYTNWKNNFGSIPDMEEASGAGGTVPEPGAVLLCLLASVGAVCTRYLR